MHRRWGIALVTAGALMVTGSAEAQQPALPQFGQAAADQYGAGSTSAAGSPDGAAATPAGSPGSSGSAPSTSSPSAGPGSGVAPDSAAGTQPGPEDGGGDLPSARPDAAAGPTPAAAEDDGATEPAGDEGTTTPGTAPATSSSNAPATAAGSAVAGEGPGAACVTREVRLPRPLAGAVTTRSQREGGCAAQVIELGGAMPARVRAGVARAARLAGLRLAVPVLVTPERLRAFLASDRARELGDGPAAIGAALAGRLLDGAGAPDPLAAALLGPGAALPSLEHVVVTQAPGLDARGSAFAAGVARGLWERRVPVGFAAASDAAGSTVAAYARRRVPAVHGVDAAGGARDLAAILVEEVQGTFGGARGADAPLDAAGELLRVDRTAAGLGDVVRGADGGGVPTALLLAALALAAACWGALGLRHGRRRAT